MTMIDSSEGLFRNGHEWIGVQQAAGRIDAAMRRNPQWLAGLVAFGISAVSMATMAIVIALGNHALYRDRAWVQHTDDVLLTAAGVREDLLSSANARLRYIISGNRAYLDLHTRHEQAAGQHIMHLAGLVSDNPTQVARVTRLRKLVDQQNRSNVAEIMSLDPEAQLSVARAEMAHGRAPRDPQQLFVLFGAIRSTELGLLSVRQRRLDTAQILYLSLEGVFFVLALLGVALGVYLVQHQRVAAHSRELELQIMQMQRLGLMNQTSSVLAHELSQPLSAAMNYFRAYSRLAERGGNDTGRLGELREKVASQINRTVAIVKRLRSFVEASEGARLPENPEELVKDAVELLASFDSDVSIATETSPGLPSVFVDRVQVQQVLVNLMRNAIESMEGCPNKILLLSARPSAPGEVEFCLEDRGKGLSEDQMRRLFAPFVSGKKDGMGVGLSISRSIVANHGGKIWASAAKGGGAMFHFTLPVAGRTQTGS